MIQQYAEPVKADSYSAPSPTDRLIAGIAAIVNILLGCFVIYVLGSRLIAVIIGHQMVPLDWFFEVFGVVLTLTKVTLAIFCAILAFTQKSMIGDDIIKIAGIAAVLINLIFFLIYMALMFVMGPKDPTHMTFYMFLVASLVLLGELASSATYLYFLEYKQTSRYEETRYEVPSRQKIAYMPVYQLQSMP